MAPVPRTGQSVGRQHDDREGMRLGRGLGARGCPAVARSVPPRQAVGSCRVTDRRPTSGLRPPVRRASRTWGRRRCSPLLGSGLDHRSELTAVASCCPLGGALTCHGPGAHAAFSVAIPGATPPEQIPGAIICKWTDQPTTPRHPPTRRLTRPSANLTATHPIPTPLRSAGTLSHARAPSFSSQFFSHGS